MDLTLLRRCGLAAVAGAALAILGNAFLFIVNPAVPDDRLSYPLSPQAYVPMQLFFALTQAAGGRSRGSGLLRRRSTQPSSPPSWEALPWSGCS